MFVPLDYKAHSEDSRDHFDIWDHVSVLTEMHVNVVNINCNLL